MSWAALRPELTLIVLLPALSVGFAAEQVVVDFESAPTMEGGDADAKPSRVPQWVEKGVTFTLAWEPRLSKAKGMLMFFTHLGTGHKGIVCAMATEPIPVRATFPKPIASVTVALWGSTGMPALLEAFDEEGKVVDRASLESVPGRKTPGEPVPIFTMSVSGKRIAYVQFSGPREGEYLAADEVRFTPLDDSDPK
jgi:hypothetical protein